MKAFKCLKCGTISYSSASLDNQRNPECPYCGACKNIQKEEFEEENKCQK